MWITRVSVRHPVFATMLMLALAVLGTAAWLRLGVEQMPDITLPGATVRVAWPGVSPAAVERELTRPLEEAINGIPGLKRLVSRSYEGRAEINAEFQLDVDFERALALLRDRLSALSATLPREARAPEVERFGTDNAQPVVALALSGGGLAPRALTALAEGPLLRALQRVPGVARVELAGLQRRELRLELDPQRLRALALTPAEVAEALRAQQAEAPVGLLSDGQGDTLLRVEGRAADARALAQVVVARRGTLVVTLADLGRFVDGQQPADALARVNGEPAVLANVYRASDANVVAVGRAVLQAAQALQPQLPPGTSLRTLYANSDWVQASLAGLQRTLAEGALLTVAIVFVFLRSWRSTVITALALPLSVLASFGALAAFGYTLNFMTMMALSLSIGLLVDDAIVVRENIVRHLARGQGPVRAALEGTAEIGLAVLATTLAVAAVFLPVGFMDGVVGRFFKPFALTVVASVLASLAVSFTLDPMLSAVWRDRQAHRPDSRWQQALQTGYVRALAAMLRRSGARGWRRLAGPRARVLAGAGLAFVAAVALVPWVGTEFVPPSDEGFTRMALRLPEGTALARASAKVAQVEAALRALPEVQTVSAQIGGVGQRNQATLDVALRPRAQRSRSQQQVEAAMRAAIAGIPGIEATVGFNRPIQFSLLGDDPAQLAALAQRLADQVRQIPGAVDVETSVRPGIPAQAVRLKPEAVRELGLSPAAVAASLRAYVGGEEALQWPAPDGRSVALVLRLPEAERQRLGQLGGLPVAWARDGTAIPLERVATVEPVFNPEVIRRQDLQRREAVWAGVQGRPAGEVGAEVQALLKRSALPPGVRLDLGGQTRDQQQAFTALLVAMGLAALFLYMVLASQFGSFVQPLAILASLPLALVGVVPALWLSGSTLNLFSMIGLVMLMGLVTKNAILLVDAANQNRRAGMAVDQALIEAGAQRLRPILMTTAAMVFGMLPLAIGSGLGGILGGGVSADLQAPMGRAIIGGVLGSALLTLGVVPVLYSLLPGRVAPLREAEDQAAPEDGRQRGVFSQLSAMRTQAVAPSGISSSLKS